MKLCENTDLEYGRMYLYVGVLSRKTDLYYDVSSQGALFVPLKFGRNLALQ